MNVTFKQVQAFVAVAETNSFSRAGELLNIAQSRVSILIRDLEHELAVRLFDRTTRRMELTAAGRDFRPHAEKLVADLKHAVEDTHALGERRRGRLTVAAPPLLMEALIPRLLVPFKSDFPGVRVTLLDARTESIMEAVKTGEADIGIGTFPRLEEGLVRTRLASDPLLLFCGETHPLATLRRPRWADILGAPLIALRHESGVRPLFDYGCSAAGGLPQVEYEVSLVTTALALVEVGVGVAVLPANALSVARHRPIVARPLSQPTVMRDISMIARHGRSLSPAAAEWVQRLQHDMKALKRTHGVKLSA
jgi:DNA-binding transcriptional LysR family regulator